MSGMPGWRISPVSDSLGVREYVGGGFLGREPGRGRSTGRCRGQARVVSGGRPARVRIDEAGSPTTVGDLARSVWEAVELPGEPSDYHYVLQGAVDRLWSRRRAEPAGLRHMESFAYLDLDLIEAVPSVVRLRGEEDLSGFLRVTSVERLLGVLEREGALREAVAVCRRAQRFGDRFHRDDLVTKVAALDMELR